MKLRTSILSAALASAAALGLAGCGGGSSYTTGTTGGGGGGGGMNGNVASVAIVDYGFSPDTITVKVGTTITWSNTGAVAHTSTSDGGLWDSGQLASPTGGGAYGGSAGGSFAHTFGAAGTFSYHCANHTTMTGAVVVTP